MGNQAKEDGSVPLTPNVDTDFASGDAPKKTSHHKLVYIIVALFLLLNVIALYILHFVDNSASKATAVSGTFKSSDLSSASTSASKGLAVSYATDGKLRVGAGTTAYLDAATLPETAMSYMQFAPMGTSQDLYDTNLMTYLQGTSTIVTTISADTSAKSLSIAAASDANTITSATPKAFVTLSDKTAVVLTTVTSSDGLTTSAYTTPITLGSSNSVSVQTAKKVLAANGSATNFMAPLGDSTFIHVFFEPYTSTATYYERVQVGTVGSDGAITFSSSVVFGNGNSASGYTSFGQPQKVLNSSTRFAVPWFVDTSYATSSGNSTTTNPGLCISTFSYSNNNLTAGTDVCSTKYMPAYYVDATKLSENVLALAFIDTANKNALTILTVEYSEITYTPTFRSAIVINEATGKFDFGSSYGFYPKPSIHVLGDNRVAIGFLNPSNSGKPSIKVFKYSSDLSLTEASPVLSIANADFTVATANAKAYGAVVLNTLPITSGFMVAFGGTWATKTYQRVSLVESFGDPIGVITSSGSDVSVAMAGTTSVDADLTSGRSYYAASNGKLYTPSTSSSDKYVLVNEDKIVITRSALVGVATSSSELFISAQAN